MEKQFYISKEQFTELKASWKKLAETKTITASDILIYNILRSKKPSLGFTATTNNCHIQGNDPWFAFQSAKWDATSKYTSSWKPELTDARKQKFKDRFGIDMPEDFKTKINEASHE